MHSIHAKLSAWRAGRVPSSLMLALLFAACNDGPVAPASHGITLAPPLLSESRADRAFNFTTVDYPGSSATQVFGINGRGDIVGVYVLGGLQHGFLLRDGEFTTIDYPQAVATDVRGIGPDGDIVGTYRLAGQTGQIHGFVRTNDGEFRPIDSPGHINTIAQRILPDGTILGCHHDNDMMASMEGITVSRDGLSVLNVFASMNNGATPGGRTVVGLYMNMDEGNRQEGYRIDDGVFTPLLVPGSNFTTAWDINPAGDIVGVYRRTDNTFHGYLLRDGIYTTLDFPGATATRAFGINVRGDVVGNYALGGKTFGFVATR